MNAHDIDPAWLEQAKRAHDLLTRHGYVITNALRCHAEHMSEASGKAQAGHEQGDHGPLITNYGLKVAAGLLSHTADLEREVADLISQWSETNQ
ncbi:hypothetical protein [Nonomuraea basaltis]|uniref:hypothetical protein n=1 Tax=Nonomuraea basaltis TaxID=2495887 RepID=UPI00110C420B|nr:hypothetical protein [Nonomuraea basaltis]TMR89491.1 hypothetical protein EJK15_60445 [Nonomuraea basaltis]